MPGYTVRHRHLLFFFPGIYIIQNTMVGWRVWLLKKKECKSLFKLFKIYWKKQLAYCMPKYPKSWKWNIYSRATRSWWSTLMSAGSVTVSRSSRGSTENDQLKFQENQLKCTENQLSQSSPRNCNYCWNVKNMSKFIFKIITVTVSVLFSWGKLNSKTSYIQNNYRINNSAEIQ